MRGLTGKSAQEALEGVRIGCVQYLNSAPLIDGLERVRLEHPRILAGELQRGGLDVALVPVYELLRDSGRYQAVSGVGIVSRGPVYSVYVATRGELEEMEVIVADPASLTSVHLVQVLCTGALGRAIPLVESVPSEVPERAVGKLLIGNQALVFREGAESGKWKYWDLGEAWDTWTGLPFVYALWVMRRELPNAAAVAEALRDVARGGMSRVEAIAEAQSDFSVETAKEYLKRHIQYEVGEREREGLGRFRFELVRGGWLKGRAEALVFV